MALFKRKTEENPQEIFAVPQTCPVKGGFSDISSFASPTRADLKLYSALRSSIPVIDAAIMKLIRLLGTFEIKCGDKKAEKEINRFLKEIKVGTAQRGINAFISNYFSELLTYGTAVGEIIYDGFSIAGLYNTDLDCVELKHGKSPLELVVCAYDGFGSSKPVEYPELILVSSINPQAGNVYGVSILRGLPFVSDILLKIYNAIGSNWERIGNIRYAVTYKPQNDSADKAYAKKRAEQVAEQWGKTMQSTGPVRDFVAVGDLSIKVIGADNQILDSEIPVRQMLEQIVAKLGVPPFLLGLNWSSTERMSSQQSDILTSELEYYREIINSVIRKICSLHLRLCGFEDSFDIVWNEITLQDGLQTAQMRYYNAQAEKYLKESEGEKNE